LLEPFGLKPSDAVALYSALFAGMSAIIAVVAVLISLYIQFWRGAKVFGWISQITIIRVSLTQNNELLVQMLADDLLSESPGAAAQTLLSTVQGLPDLARRRDRSELIRSISVQTLRLVNYVPSDELIDRYGLDGKIPVSFYATVLLSNTGGKPMHISNFVLLVQSASNPDRCWAFAAYMTMNLPMAIDPSAPKADMQRFAGFFGGASVSPGQTLKLDLYFVPHVMSAGVRLSTGGMPPGDYQMSLVGYRAGTDAPEKVFSTMPFKYPFSSGHYKTIFTGGEWTFLVGTEEEALDAWRAHRSA
jgi:hypothetical protein